MEAECPHLAVVVHGRLVAVDLFHVADQLGQPPLHDAKRVVHLQSPILGRGVAQTVHRSGVGLGKDVRNSPAVAHQLDLAVVVRRQRKRRQPEQGSEQAEDSR